MSATARLQALLEMNSTSFIRGMDGAVVKTKSFEKNMRDVKGSLGQVGGVFNTMSGQLDGFAGTAVGAGQRIAMVFASGGPVLGAIAAAAAGLTYIVKRHEDSVDAMLAKSREAAAAEKTMAAETRRLSRISGDPIERARFKSEDTTDAASAAAQLAAARTAAKQAEDRRKGLAFSVQGDVALANDAARAAEVVRIWESAYDRLVKADKDAADEKRKTGDQLQQGIEKQMAATLQAEDKAAKELARDKAIAGARWDKAAADAQSTVEGYARGVDGIMGRERSSRFDRVGALESAGATFGRGIDPQLCQLDIARQTKDEISDLKRQTVDRLGAIQRTLQGED